MRVSALTPLWTGGVDVKMERIHETSLLGSMRWWYEVLVRGLGGEVCQEDNGCEFNADQYIKSGASDEGNRLREAGLCDVCQLFGATGWKRRFCLSVSEKNIKNADIQHCIKAERSYEIKNERHTPTWYFQDPPKIGEFEMRIQSLDYEFPAEVIEGLIQFIADWGALGARDQMGFGIIELIDDRIDTNPLYKNLITTAGNCQYDEMPSLKNIFLARIKLKNAREVETFNLKYDLRQLFSTNRDVRHFVMGTTTGEKMAAKVKISRPYNDGLMRVWGWIPEEANCYNNSWNRNRVATVIYNHLTTCYDLEVWREMSSMRDTIIPNTTDPKIFLQSLLELEEG